ncbi:probable E3 ubiquitin-protein ligase TRIML1 [Dromiciops gliroides]|uniref:probable E3 ubiquitin-protein ligase TRIML1 n=1 Tax=Dromiciops gliroides TaxID=33562 RepID=UPI001CC6892D|nr:probable E3 ubiquitin-protein ligase TRIML1 [Dromiciops gliroides]
MAEAPLAENLKEDLTCPLCKHYSSHPVTLGCVHNVCRQCHLRDRREADQPCPCPDFRRTFEMIERDLEPDHHLGNLASIARNIRPYLLSLEEERVICERHQRKALLFCEHEQSLICASCSQSPEHSSHTVYTIKKAAKDSRDKLQKLSDLCHVEMEIVENMLCEERQKEKMWKEKGQAWRESIIAQYRRFHELLKKEEELHLLTFTQEETKKVKNVRENEVKLYQHLQRLREEMVDLEQKRQKSDLQLLQVVGDTLTRCESMLSHIPEVVTAPSTIFQNTLMWEMLKHFKVDIILDPESACPHLIVSDDLKTVLHGSYQQNYRFENCVILGIQVFTSGIHYWEVDVGEGMEKHTLS